MKTILLLLCLTLCACHDDSPKQSNTSARLKSDEPSSPSVPCSGNTLMMVGAGLVLVLWFRRGRR